MQPIHLTLDRDELPSERQIRDFLLHMRYPPGTPCPRCGKTNIKFYALTNRKSYTCASCGWHVSATAGTVLEKSPVPLRDWLWVGLRVATEKRVTSAALAREIGVTYKTAWRMRSIVKKLLGRLV